MLTQKNEEQKSETLTNQLIPNLMYLSQIGKNASRSSNIKPQHPYPTTQTLNMEGGGTLVDNNKHNPHTKLRLLNKHNQNPNITTVQMLMVLLQ